VSTNTDGAEPSSGPASGPGGGPGVAETVEELPYVPATAFGVEGYDPEDPWNAVLCVESDEAVTVLPLTPRTLEDLLGALGEVRAGQRESLRLPPDEMEEGYESEPSSEERRGFFRRFASVARLATGSTSVSRVWNESLRGRLTIIGGAVLFVLLGVILSIVTR
jgi:hypothetical protein